MLVLFTSASGAYGNGNGYESFLTFGLGGAPILSSSKNLRIVNLRSISSMSKTTASLCHE
ncbi:hypothetical protein [Paraburkholderia sp. GAS334]|uniref:hypothetical protein n=1 Tax=Paraburkholderia sp. GAS334 TaxID=3035131 RepID=UPI003D24A1B3